MFISHTNDAKAKNNVIQDNLPGYLSSENCIFFGEGLELYNSELRRK